ncbi:hypothetical protein BC826DRAFT_494536 [Russula brevipes]|nr:hypothetical protein BC826DRAFT_494536 [Russula brevipes]
MAAMADEIKRQESGDHEIFRQGQAGDWPVTGKESGRCSRPAPVTLPAGGLSPALPWSQQHGECVAVIPFLPSFHPYTLPIPTSHFLLPIPFKFIYKLINLLLLPILCHRMGNHLRINACYPRCQFAIINVDHIPTNWGTNIAHAHGQYMWWENRDVSFCTLQQCGYRAHRFLQVIVLRGSFVVTGFGVFPFLRFEVIFAVYTSQ